MYRDQIEGAHTQAENDMLKIMFFVYRGALWSPQSDKIVFCWPDPHTDSALLLCNAKNTVFQEYSTWITVQFQSQISYASEHNDE